MKRLFIILVLGVFISGCVTISIVKESCGSAGFMGVQVNYAGIDYKVVVCTDIGQVRFMEVDGNSNIMFKAVPKISPEGMEYFELEIIDN